MSAPGRLCQFVSWNRGAGITDEQTLEEYPASRCPGLARDHRVADFLHTSELALTASAITSHSLQIKIGGLIYTHEVQ